MPASDLQPECDLTAAQAIEWRAAPLWLQLWLRLVSPAGRGAAPHAERRGCPVHRAVAHVDGGTSHLAPRTLEERAPVPCLR